GAGRARAGNGGAAWLPAPRRAARDGGLEGFHLLARQFPEFAGAPLARQAARAEADAQQPAHFHAHCFEEPAHLAVAAFPEHHAVSGMSALAAPVLDGVE